MNEIYDPFSARGFGGGASWLDLVNSELWDGYGNFTEMLEDRVWVTTFLRYWDFRVPLESYPQHKFKTLRGQLRQLVERVASGEQLGVKQMEPLNEWLKVDFYARDRRRGWRTAFGPDSGAFWMAGDSGQSGRGVCG